MSHAHAHHHGHDHGHSHGHHHGPADYGRAFAIGILLNIVFVAVEGGFGFVTNSIALMADAGHNLSDVLGLAVAWAGAAFARRAPSKRFTWGLRGSSILAALLNSLVLMIVLGAIMLGAIERLLRPVPVEGGTVMIVAAIGIAVNLGTALLFARGRHGDINVRGAFLHMAADAAVSAGVVVAGLVILETGAIWLDPLVSLVIAAIIFWQTWGLLKESTQMALAGVPRNIDYDAVEGALAALPGVARVHDLHIWPMSTTETVLTTHLVMPGGHPGDVFLVELQHMLHHRFRIAHVTTQIETTAECFCALEQRV